jgi:hypothetical protein
MSEVFLRSTAEISLLEKKSGSSMKVISNLLADFIMNNDDYFKRCLTEVENGKAELKKQLDDARRVIFTKEDLINWFYKMKEDAKTETDMIFIRHHASIGEDEKKIDFERAGFLAGIYDEAERYLTLMVAIEPLDKDKPHYAILDRLEQLDETIVNNENIPFYYSIQHDKKILKQKYQIKCLDDYWAEYLALKDKHEVAEGFGDIKYLLDNYHREFKWELIRIRPREEIKDFLNFHLKKFAGEPIDFLNHIEFRVLPNLDGFARSDYPIYQLLIKDWLKEKRNQLNQQGEEYLLESVVSVSASFVENVVSYRTLSDENKYNTLLCSLLNQRFSSNGWTAKDQSLGGSSDSESTANRAGLSFRDFIFSDEKNHNISAMECFRLSYVPTQIESDSEIKKHLTKIFRNEPLGLSPLFILVYCETKSFNETWEKYLNYVNEINFQSYHLHELEKNISINPVMANIKVAKAKHTRETSVINVYHVFINMYP